MSTSARLWWRLFRIGMAVALLAALFALVDLRRLAASADASLLTAALLMQPLVIVGWVFAGWRHSLLVGRPRPPVLLALRAYVTGVGLNVVLPLKAGDVVKATYLRDHFGTPLTGSIGAILVSRLLDGIVVGAIGLIGLSLQLPSRAREPVLAILMTAVAGLVVLVLLPRRRLRWLARRCPPLVGRVLVALTRIAGAARPSQLACAFAVSVCGWSANFAAAATFMSVQQVLPLSVPEQAAVYAITLFASAVPGLPGGIGAFQAAGLVVLAASGHPFEPALVLLAALQAALLFGPVLFASVEVSRRRLGFGALWQRVRAVRTEEASGRARGEAR